MTSKICPICGNEFGFGRRPSYVKHRTYCSHACKEKAMAKPENKVTKTCKHCGEPFESWTYRNQQYCSRECKQTHVARQPRPTQRLKRQTVDLICEWCNTPYTVHTSQNSNGRKSRFCSVECRGKYHSANHRGINHPNWRGGGKYPDRGRNWSAQRRKAIERDNNRCQICGLRLNNKSKKLIDVHHIKPYREFNGDYLSANDLNNLITLCRSCHKRVEHGTLSCPVRLI